MESRTIVPGRLPRAAFICCLTAATEMPVSLAIANSTRKQLVSRETMARLLANAKTAEDLIQNVLDIHSARDPPKGGGSLPEVFGA